MFLYDLCENHTGIISELKVVDDFAVRLREMGFCEGETVRCLKFSVFKSPVLSHIKGSDIALRKSDAMRIGVTE